MEWESYWICLYNEQQLHYAFLESSSFRRWKEYLWFSPASIFSVSHHLIDPCSDAGPYVVFEFLFHIGVSYNSCKEFSVSSLHSSKCGLAFESSPTYSVSLAASVLSCTELRRLSCCMESVLLVTNCSGNDFSVWVVSRSPSFPKLSQLWFMCLRISTEL